MLDNNLEFDATPSWSGYIYQGKVAIFAVLKKINSLFDENEKEQISSYFLELEWLEDFSILHSTEVGIEYETIHQVKAREDSKLKDYADALIKLIKKVETHKEVKNAYLHTVKKITLEKNTWSESLKEIVMSDNTIQNWISLIHEYNSDEAKFKELLNSINRKGRPNNFISELKMEYFKFNKKTKFTEEILRTALELFEVSLQERLDYLMKGPSDEVINKAKLYTYNNEDGYCSLNEIDNLIKDEIRKYWQNFEGSEWKWNSNDSILDVVFLCLMGIVDTHITKRHQQYNVGEIERVPFVVFEEILKSDAPIERCKEYYLYTIKEKMLIYCDEYINTCYQDCVDENDFSCCELCQISDFKQKVLAMSFEGIYELVIVTNPDIASNLNRLGFSDYCERNRYFNPFFNGIKEIAQKYGEEKIPISYIDKNKKLYLLTTICDNGVSRKPIKQVCKNIIDNSALSEVFMDYEVIISKDLDSDSILNDAGDFLSEFKKEENNIYHYKDVSMKNLESCKDILH